MKKIAFVTGTRADFSKIKSLMQLIENSPKFELLIFATGMHLSKQFGLTINEIEKSNFKNIFKFINHDKYYQTDRALATTIDGFSKFIAEFEPDLIVVHGDRIEPLAATIVGALNNILVAHIEGGEISGTIDDSIRHAISKLAHVHLVNDEKAKNRLIQLGESEDSIFIIGSPDLDILKNTHISLQEVKNYYDINFDRYSILLFHPVTTELDSLEEQTNNLIDALLTSGKNYVVIYPNNDLGFDIILRAYTRLKDNRSFKFFPSLRFEYFLTLLKHADFIIGNSSCALKEAIFLNTPSINIGTRQNGRAGIEHVINAKANTQDIMDAISGVKKVNSNFTFDNLERSDKRFFEILLDEAKIFTIPKQKIFKDLI